MAQRLGKLYALTDQVLYSATSLLISLFYARYMTADDYASFAVFLSALLFAHGIHRAIIILPMLKALASDELNVNWWNRTNFRFCLITSSAATMILSAIDALGQRNSLGVNLLFGSGLLFFLLYEFNRRLFFAQSRAHLAAATSLLFLSLNLAGLVANVVLFAASLPIGICFYAASTALSLLPFAVRRRMERSGSDAETGADRAEMLWNLAAFFPYSVYNNAMPLILAAVGAHPAVAVFAATRLFFAPATTLISAVDSVDKPKAARAFRTSRRELSSTLKQTALVLTRAIGLYAILIVAFKDPLIVHSIGQKYEDHGQLLNWWMAAAFFMAIGQPVETGLIILGKARILFISRVIAAAGALLALATTLSQNAALSPVLSVATGWFVSVVISSIYLLALTRRVLR